MSAPSFPLLSKTRSFISGLCSFGLAILLASLVSKSSALGANSEVPATGKADDTVSPETRTYLQLQEQLHATQLAVDQTRQESEQAAAQNTQALDNRLKLIEQSLAAQRAKELDAMQSSNRVMLIVAGSFAGMGFVAMVLMGYFQWRTIHRLAEISAILPQQAIGPSSGRGRLRLGVGEAVVTSAPMAIPGPENSALLRTIERLEQRVRELETEPGDPGSESSGKRADGSQETIEFTNGFHAAVETIKKEAVSVDVVNLLNKGQSLLNDEKAEEALACFDEALTTEPNHAEGLVKKGNALEKLRKFEEAIDCYNKAIVADNAMTIAYLHKGGLFNRMERFTEALECYEKALQTQEKQVAA
jgi:tetratricopeptide (TPR) repeat protein